MKMKINNKKNKMIYLNLTKMKKCLILLIKHSNSQLSNMIYLKNHINNKNHQKSKILKKNNNKHLK